MYFDSLSQVRMPSWSSGRVVLVVTLAYCASPVAGAGAMLSLVGAYRLGGELAAADHHAAYRRYEAGFATRSRARRRRSFLGLFGAEDAAVGFRPKSRGSNRACSARWRASRRSSRPKSSRCPTTLE